MKPLIAFLALLATPAFAEEPAKPNQLFCYIEADIFSPERGGPIHSSVSFKGAFNEVTPGVFYASAAGRLAGNVVSASAQVSSMGPVLDAKRTLEDLTGEIKVYTFSRILQFSWVGNGGKHSAFCRIE